MALKQVGIDAVIGGLSNFLDGIAQINKSLSSVGNAVNLTNGKLSVMGATLDKQMQRWRDANGRFVSSVDVNNRLASSMTNVRDGSLNAVAGMAELTSSLMSMYTAAVQADEELRNKPGDMNRVATAGDILRQIVDAVGLGFSKLGAILSLMGRGFNYVMGFIGNLINGVRNLSLNLFGLSQRAWDVAKGYLFGNMIRWLVEQLRDVGKEAVKAASDFQLLEIRFRTVAARDFARELGITIPQAMDRASIKAKQLLEWVRALAVTTPYKATDVARSLALANSYGLQAEEAQVLTQATLDFAAAMGLTEEHIYRIIYNFGQMQQQGKLTGREFRDLAISFVPVYDIIDEIAKEAGVAAKDMEKMALEGGVPVETFFRKFVQMVNRDFKGAAKEMSTTLQGVWDNIKDTFQLLVGVDFLGPLASMLAASLDTVLQRIKSFREGAMIMGGVLKLSFYNVASAIVNDLLPALGELASAFGITWQGAKGLAFGMAWVSYGIRDAVALISRLITDIAEWIKKTFGRLQENGHTYGYNLIMQFARGMAAAIKFIVGVIASIARIIANFFAPGSPPKIAPDIDRWGALMVDEWVEGIMSERDWVSNSISEGMGQSVEKGFTEASTKAVNSSNPVEKVVRDYIAEARVAVEPLIRQFGGGVMAGIMGGWGTGNFTAFEDIAGVVDSFIRSLKGISIGEEGIVPRILGSRSAIASAINDIRSGVKSVADAIKDIMNSMGNTPVGFGDYIRSLVSSEKAQSNLTDAQKLGNSLLETNDQILSRMSGDVAAAGAAYVDALNKMNEAIVQSTDAETALETITDAYEERLKELRRELEEVTTVYDEKRELEEIDKALSTKILTTRERERLEMKKKAILIKQEIRALEDQRDQQVASGKENVDAARQAEQLAKEEADRRQRYMMELAQAQADSAQAQVEAAKMLIDAQIEQNNLIREQMDLLAQLAQKSDQAGGGGAGDMGDLAGSLGDLIGQLEEFQIPDVQQKVNQIMSDALRAFEAWKGKIGKSIAEAFGYESWDKMVEDLWVRVIMPIEIAFVHLQQWWEREMAPRFKNWGDVLSPGINSVSQALGRLGISINSLGGGNKVLGAIVDVLGAITSVVFLAGTLAISVAINGFAGALAGVGRVIEWFKPVWQWLVDGWKLLEEQWAGASTFWERLGILAQAGLLILSGAFLAVSEIVAGVLGAILGAIIGFWIGVVDWFTKLYNKLVGKSIVPEMMDKMKTIISDALTEILDKLVKWIDDVIRRFEQFGKDLGGKVTTAWEDIKSAISNAANYIRDKIIAPLIQDIKDKFSNDNKPLADTALAWFSNVGTSITNVVTGIFAPNGPVLNLLNGVSKSLSDNATALYNAAFSWFSKAKEGVEYWTGYILGQNGTIGTFLYNVGVIFRNAYNDLKSAAQVGFGGISQGIVNVFSTVYNWLVGKIGELRSLLENLKDIADDVFSGGGNKKDPPTCFIAGTQIETPDGRRRIEDIRVGDMVLMKKRRSNKVVTVVVNKLISDRRNDVVRATFADDTQLTGSPNHPVNVPGLGWVRMENLRPGYIVNGLKPRSVVSVEPYAGEHVVYNFEVNHPEHTYLAEGIMVHNAKPVTDTAITTGVSIGQSIAQGVVDGFQKELEMASPSKKFERMGVLTMEGYVNGLRKSATAVANTFGVQTAMMRRVAPAKYGNTDNSRNVSVSVNASYANVQSPSGIYYDVTAALAASRM